MRPQPALGTVEIRIMDAQPICRDAAPLLALTACLVRLEAEEGFAGPAAIAAQEAIEENRFLAARDGVDAELIDPVRDRRIPLSELLVELVGRCEPHDRELGCAAELAAVAERLASPAARRQIQNARAAPSLAGLVELLADRYVEGDERPGAAGGAAMS